MFLDSGALIAAQNPRDEHHQSAHECLRKIAAHRLPVFAPSPAVYETHRLLLFRLGRAGAREALQNILDGSVTIVPQELVDEERALQLLDRYSDVDLTLTDAVSMAIMERLRIATCMSFDHHFSLSGFIRIPPFHL